jgi:hypothetical protein
VDDYKIVKSIVAPTIIPEAPMYFAPILQHEATSMLVHSMINSKNDIMKHLWNLHHG